MQKPWKQGASVPETTVRSASTVSSFGSRFSETNRASRTAKMAQPTARLFPKANGGRLLVVSLLAILIEQPLPSVRGLYHSRDSRTPPPASSFHPAPSSPRTATG